ncbi:hypothetical protein [Flavobacterium granuli]|uniref:Uncharacterized protein n=1 Tax=Flavobacterium granuli TaxID=280093 RepID=A0A1M5J0G5_9FLAO|nr:hypothetical protein [Flavobacterium granuli]PRZ28185.1 hypothetical protein BC624_101476 [Flavobacterium granuli]SHG34011.1 hypothetical protein SAMN05443373_101476 [Flavobacterium granuli]
MGKLEGIVRFTGSFDGLSFYKLRGKIVVRKTGGFKGDAIKTQANYVRTRENASQFGYCSRAGKALRMALFPFVRKIREPYMHNYVVSLLIQIVNFDTLSLRGCKTLTLGLASDEGRSLLNGFDFNKELSFKKVFPVAYTVSLAEGKFVVPVFKMGSLSFPVGATHIGLQFLLLRFDFDLLDYQLQTSEVCYFAKADSEASCELVAPAVGGNGSLLGLVFASFYQEINGERYALEGCVLSVVDLQV